MLIQVDLTLPAPEHPKDLPLEAKMCHFAGDLKDMVDEIAAGATTDAICAEIQATWLVKHTDQSTDRKKITSIF